MTASLRRPVAATHGRYQVQSPTDGPIRLTLIGFHGYAETAEIQLERLQALPGAEQAVLVSIQGLHRFYRGRMNDVADVLRLTDRAIEADGSAAVSRACREFFNSLALPSRLRELTVPYDALHQIADDVSHDWFFSQNPRPMQRADLMQLLEAAW